jgi:hypothetical protein
VEPAGFVEHGLRAAERFREVEHERRGNGQRRGNRWNVDGERVERLTPTQSARRIGGDVATLGQNALEAGTGVAGQGHVHDIGRISAVFDRSEVVRRANDTLR